MTHDPHSHKDENGNVCMIDSPFAIFRPFADRFRVTLCQKEDMIGNDTDLMRFLQTEKLASLKQVHGNRIVLAQKPMLRTEEADGMITTTQNLWLSIRAADCQPIVAYAPSKHVAGVLHAGWKGLQSRAISAFFSRLQEEWGIEPADTFVAIGPSLCSDCAQFTDPAQELSGIDPRFFRGRHANLPGIADSQILSVGVPASHIERSEDCTKCRSDLYWSYRGGDREAVMRGETNVLACVLL